MCIRDRLAAATEELREKGYEVQEMAANLTEEEDIQRVVAFHRDRRSDADIQTKRADMQLDVNLRAIVLFYRECAAMLKAAGGEHRGALVVNMASIAGKSGQGWLSVYSATKFAVVGYTQAMNKELAGDGVKSVAFCPGFVDTDMTEFVKGQIEASEMIRPEDIAEAVRFLLRTSRNCHVPEIVFTRPGEGIGGP